MPILKTRAIVVSKMEYSETSQIVALLTPSCGIVSGLAKGARRIKGIYEGGFDLFDTVLTVILVKNQGLSTITESRLAGRPMSLRKKPAAFMAASAGREIVLKCTGEQDPNFAVYRTMQRFIDALEVLPETKAPLALVAFELAFLGSQGIAPELSCCAICGEPLPRRRILTFDAREGGLLCPGCQKGSHMAMKLRPGAIVLAQKLKNEGFGSLISLAPNRALLVEVQNAIRLTLAYSSFIVPKALQYVWN